MKFQIIGPIIFMVVLSFTSCRKFVEIGRPKTQIVSANVFSSDATATAAMEGIYSQMITSSGFASGSLESVTRIAGMSADELVNYSPDADNIEFYDNSILPSNGTLYSALWQEPYQYIYQANSIIEGLHASKTVSEKTKTLLTGEAKFIRAFCYFYLVNLFGDVPLATTTNWEINNELLRSSPVQVYNQIVKDLTDAQSELSDNYLSSVNAPATDRVRPNKWAATALLARVYLFTQNWEEAEKQAGLVINYNPLYQLVNNLDSVFLKNSAEAIWQLMPVIPGSNTNEAQVFMITGTPNNVALSNSLYNSFEPGDKRKALWIRDTLIGSTDYHYAYKYKVSQFGAPLTEYSMVLRLAEQYLIRAEARAEMGNLTGALEDLNQIRERAGLADLTTLDRAAILTAIDHERRVELFCEWGHRWLDLKRRGKADAVLSAIKPGWKSTAALYPIPQTEIDNNHRLSQNPGY